MWAANSRVFPEKVLNSTRFEADYVGRTGYARGLDCLHVKTFRGRLCGAHRSFQRRKVAVMTATCHLFDVPGGCR